MIYNPGEVPILEPKLVLINIDIKNRNIETIIAKTIIRDFNQFKEINELNVCSLNQSKPSSNSINVTWKTERRYQSRLIDYDRIERDFNEFAEFNKDELCQISNMYCKDDNYVVEYNIYRTYILNFTK